MLKNTIVALDQLSIKDIDDLMPKLHQFNHFKLGLEIFNKHGKDYISIFQNKYNKSIFLDLKLHDIPKTVYQAIKSLDGIKIQFLTIHLTGGREMIEAAMEAKRKYLPNTTILGVSYLTSLGNNDFNELFGAKESEISQYFERLFRLAAECKIDGLISSPHELDIISRVEETSGHQFVKITPGIRFSSDSIDDQKRVMTPKEAFAKNADFIVMGRAITKSENLNEVIEKLSH